MKKLDTNQKICIKIMTNMYENKYENKLDRNDSIYITDNRKKLILISLKNLQNQKNQSKKEKKKLLKMQLFFLMEGQKFLILLKVQSFQKENKEKDLQVF